MLQKHAIQRLIFGPLCVCCGCAFCISCSFLLTFGVKNDEWMNDWVNVAKYSVDLNQTSGDLIQLTSEVTTVVCDVCSLQTGTHTETDNKALLSSVISTTAGTCRLTYLPAPRLLSLLAKWCDAMGCGRWIRRWDVTRLVTIPITVRYVARSDGRRAGGPRWRARRLRRLGDAEDGAWRRRPTSPVRCWPLPRGRLLWPPAFSASAFNPLVSLITATHFCNVMVVRT